MGPGGFRRLQICSGSSMLGLGGFDSYTSPPLFSIVYSHQVFYSAAYKNQMYINAHI